MTRKHFNALAAALRHVATDDGTDAVTMLAAIDAVASVCRANNPNFDSARFVAACTGVNA